MAALNTQINDVSLKKHGGNDIDLSRLSQEDLKKVRELEGRVEAMAKSTGGDYTLVMQPGIVWAMNVERGVLTYPLNDLLHKGIEITLGYALHEGGHRDITRVVDKFWRGRETLRVFFNVVEDPRVNLYEESKWPGSSFFLSKTYTEEWPELDGSKPIEYYDDYKVQPHLQFLNSVIYYHRYGVIDPRIKNEKVKEVFLKTIKSVEEAYNKHPATFKPSESQKCEAQREMCAILKDCVLPEYEKLIKESAKIIEQGLKNGKIQLAFAHGGGLSGLGTLSADELTQQARDYIESKSKELADKLEAKISRPDIEMLKRELAKDKKIRELNKILNDSAGNRILSLKDLAGNKIINARLQESQKTEWDKYFSPIASLVTILTGLLENELTKDERPKYRGSFRTGRKIDLRRYFQYKASGCDPAYDKFWMRKTLPIRPSINFTLVLDESGSMIEGDRDVNALKSLVLFIEVLNHFDLDFNIIGFSNAPSVHKEFDEEITPVNKDSFIKRVAGFMGSGATDDAAAVELAVDTIIEESDAEHKIVIILSDGEGNSGKSRNAGIDRKGRYYNSELKRVLEKADQNGIDVVGIGIGNGIKYVHDVYAKSIVENRIDHLPNAFADLLIEKILEAKSVHSNVNDYSHYDLIV